MDDPGWSWPAWKFGMKRGDLFSTLHDQYNTIPSSIQDPEAFHHDVYELSTEASTADEFHRLMTDRRAQRLRELEESLESASFEIIANPALIGTTQWEYAIQLFRTRSLDSLVRYFASYLPASHPWHHVDQDVGSADIDNQPEQATESQHQQASRFFEDSIITHEPLSITTTQPTLCDHHDLHPSPRSLTTYSDDSNASNLTDARTLSFSDSDHDHLDDVSPLPLYYSSLATTFPDDEGSPVSSAPETPESSISDPTERDVDVKIAVKEHSDFKDEFLAVELEYTESKVFVSRPTEPKHTPTTPAVSSIHSAAIATAASTASTPTVSLTSPLAPTRTRTRSLSSEQQRSWPLSTTTTPSSLHADCRRRSEDHDDHESSFPHSLQVGIASQSRLAVPKQCTRRNRFWRTRPSGHTLLERGSPRRIQKTNTSSRSIWTRQRGTRRGDGDNSDD